MLMPAAAMQLIALASAPGRSSERSTARSAARCGFMGASLREPRCYHEAESPAPAERWGPKPSLLAVAAQLWAADALQPTSVRSLTDSGVYARAVAFRCSERIMMPFTPMPDPNLAVRCPICG